MVMPVVLSHDEMVAALFEWLDPGEDPTRHDVPAVKEALTTAVLYLGLSTIRERAEWLIRKANLDDGGQQYLRGCVAQVQALMAEIGAGLADATRGSRLAPFQGRLAVAEELAAITEAYGATDGPKPTVLVAA
jgi:hypothetical protein